MSEQTKGGQIAGAAAGQRTTGAARFGRRPLLRRRRVIGGPHGDAAPPGGSAPPGGPAPPGSTAPTEPSPPDPSDAPEPPPAGPSTAIGSPRDDISTIMLAPAAPAPEPQTGEPATAAPQTWGPMTPEPQATAPMVALPPTGPPEPLVAGRLRLAWPRIPLALLAAVLRVLAIPRLVLRRLVRPPGQDQASPSQASPSQASLGQAGSVPARAARRRLPRPRWPRIRLAAIGAGLTWAVAAVTLFAVYLHVARTAPVTSDGASNALQAWDMLHGNLLLRGWQLSDVSFYTTELPQYLLIERLRGLSPADVPVAGAMTYTLLVLLAALLAKGRATGRAAIVRCLLAAGIMAAPQAGLGVYVLMGSPDHTGSAVPVLAAFLLLDRAPRRWYTATAAGLILAWALVADGIVLYTGVLPVIAVAATRFYTGRFRRPARWRDSRFDLLLAASAGASVWLARQALIEIARHGGFRIWPIVANLASPSDLGRSFAVTGHGLLMLFGADFLGQQAGLTAGLALAHLTGLALAGWALCAAVRRLPRADLATLLLAAAIVSTLAAYLLSTRAAGLPSTRDITAVLPFCAALAGRVLTAPLTRARMLPALTVVLAGYLVSLGQLVTRPAAAPQPAALGRWLEAHHLTNGLAGYWDANVTTLDTGGRVSVRSVLADGTKITSDYWEVRRDWFNPDRGYANFIVLVPAPPGFKRYPTVASVRATFGQPVHIYYLGAYTIATFSTNLLAGLVAGGPQPPRSSVPPSHVPPIPAPPGE
ncbi:MAG: hypothetical protein ACR2FU_19645 [Streptosporangiaceae bacterium]